MNTKRTVFSLLIVAMFFLSVMIMPMASAKNEKKEKVEEIGTPWFETEDKLMNELGRLSTDEIRKLAETNETVKRFIEEDLKPDGAKIESFEDLKFLPESYPEELKNTAIKDLISAQSNQTTVGTKSIVSVYVLIAADEEYRAYFGSNWEQEAYDTIEAADNAFYADHDINFIPLVYEEWESDDNEDSASQLMDDAESYTNWLNDKQGCDMMAIFTNQDMDYVGLGESGSNADAWIFKHQSFSGDCHVAQHESSHNYDCHDHVKSALPVCIMNYEHLYSTDEWCSTCDSTIETNRNHF
jgi:hypothetical protein